MVSLEEQPLRSSFGKVFMGAAGTDAAPSDDQFNRVSFLSHFDGANNGVNNAFDDGSASNHTISAQGSATQGSFGPFARPDGEFSVSFDGNGDTLSVPASSDFSPGTGDFTLEAFVNLGIAGSSIAWHQNRSTGAQVNLTGSTTLNANQWYHIAVVINSNTLKLYVDGTSDGSVTNNEVFNNNDVMTIGGNADHIGATNSMGFVNKGAAGGSNNKWFLYFAGAGSGITFKGQISNIRIIKGTALYTGNFTAPTSKLTAITNTKLLTCQSNRFVDNSASAHTATPTGNAAVSAFGPFLTRKVYDPAVNGASAFIAARADGINIADSSEFNMTGEFSVEFWVYLISNDAGGIDIMFRGYGNGQNTQIGYEPSNRHLYLYNDANPVTSSTDMHINSWNHVVCCRTSSTTSIFLNGVRVGTASYSTAVDWGGGTTQFMAYGTGEYSPAGYGTDLRLLKGSSAYDATASTLTVPTAPLTAITNTKLLLNMADGQAIDSAAQNNLTLVGTAKTSTAQKLFGTASLLLDGNSDLVTFPSEAGLYGSGNFTIEFSFRLAANVGDTPFVAIAKWETSGNQRSWMVRIDNVSSANKIKFFDSANGSSNTSSTFATSFSNETWYKIAVVNVSGTVSMYVNGTADSTTHSLATGAPYASTGLVSIGANIPSSPEQFFNGNIDDVRLSKFARYTGNYTAQSEPFPDKGK